MSRRVWGPRKAVFILFLCCAQLLLLVSCAQRAAQSGAGAAGPSEEVERRLARVRQIGAAPVPKDTDKVNQELDQIGAFLTSHAASARPVLRRELIAEAKAGSPNQFFLLDMGFAAARLGESDAAMKALLRIDPKHGMIEHSSDEMFWFTYWAAEQGHAEAFPVIDRIVLEQNYEIFIPKHVLKLDPTLQGAFLYGVLGPMSEQHLLGLLDARSAGAQRILEILNWLGTRECVPAVKRAIERHPDTETLKRAVGALMRVGGAPGRAALLDLDPTRLEPAAREYLSSVRNAISATSLESMTKALGGPCAPLSDVEARKRLEHMVENKGIDDDTNPCAIVQSSIPTPELVERLERVRSSMFRRVSDEALDEVQVTNMLINAVEYRN